MYLLSMIVSDQATTLYQSSLIFCYYGIKTLLYLFVLINQILLMYWSVCVCFRRRWRWMRTTVLSWRGGSVKSGRCASSPDCLKGQSRPTLTLLESTFVVSKGTAIHIFLVCLTGMGALAMWQRSTMSLQTSSWRHMQWAYNRYAFVHEIWKY